MVTPLLAASSEGDSLRFDQGLGLGSAPRFRHATKIHSFHLTPNLFYERFRVAIVDSVS